MITWEESQPSDELITHVANALFEWNTPDNPYFVIQGRHDVTHDENDPYVPIVKVVYAAIQNYREGE